ncbi:amidase family protein [Allokutzneria sp. A3M-2-11 16]|uniref:amidase family protein n=1 Tax=Allokutzneria sp. A3M-2-11 16 TaxID=2962043 RepID=UPI0020B63AC5|nr:amidase family protein [Allokutzneria sp. A3M-2-11 16]MCP3801181.1 amidase family protein [Allokutzneria sp. A3M-2-11 16]
MRRRLSTVLLAAVTIAAFTPAANASENLDSATIPALQQRMAAGQLNAVRLTNAYLHRIRTVDHKVRAVLRVEPDALAQAAASDARRKANALRGPLDGIPVLLKDNIDAGVTTVGSRALLSSRPAKDAELVRKLRAAGAVILGKTNLSEWANFRSTNATSGWSGVGGQTANPHVLDRNPCGSSSGSGAAVAASLAQVAIGTETNGSIVCPAGANGIVGLKPTLGTVSGEGVAPISHEQDTAGPMARHVVDAALTLNALRIKPAAAEKATLKGARIGVWRKAGLDKDTDRVVNATVDRLRANGVTVVDVELPYLDQTGKHSLDVLLSEFKHDLPAYLATRVGGPKTLEELIRFNTKDPVELSKFGQELFTQTLAAPPTTDPEYRRKRALVTDLSRRSIDETVAKHRLDAILAPTNSPAWKTEYGQGDAFVLGSGGPAAMAGYPNITVPAGAAGPLPIGVSLFAGRDTDARLLAYAADLDKLQPARLTPRYLPTLPR